jgi:hypothetical protein
MAQFVTHIQPTMMEASHLHFPHHHGMHSQIHASHLPHSGHNMPSPPTAHPHPNANQHQQHKSTHHGKTSSSPLTTTHHHHHHHHHTQHFVSIDYFLIKLLNTFACLILSYDSNRNHGVHCN